VQLVADIMSGTAAASQQQSAGIDQVNQAITQMDEITQQNAALVEQAAAASESMQVQAMKLAQLVDTFKLSDSGRAAAPARRKPVREKSRPALSGPALVPQKRAAAGGARR
jgi:hypothetical protein